MGVAGYNNAKVNRPPEVAGDWSVPSRLGGLQVALILASR